MKDEGKGKKWHLEKLSAVMKTEQLEWSSKVGLDKPLTHTLLIFGNSNLKQLKENQSVKAIRDKNVMMCVISIKPLSLTYWLLDESDQRAIFNFIFDSCHFIIEHKLKCIGTITECRDTELNESAWQTISM